MLALFFRPIGATVDLEEGQISLLSLFDTAEKELSVFDDSCDFDELAMNEDSAMTGGLPPRGGGHSQAHPHSPTAQHNRMMNRVRRH